MSADNRDYYQKRAETELEMAQNAAHAEAVRAHYLMAGYYLDLVHNEDAQSPPDAEPDGGAGIEEWVVRCAGKAKQEHGALAGDYVATRIIACRERGDNAALQLWEEVRKLVAEPALPTNAA